MRLTRANASTVPVSGFAILAPGIVPNPTALFFGQQAVGTTSAPQTVILTNDGSAPLNIVSISASGDFAQTNTCVGSVQPANNCAINVTFSPTSPGNRFGQITINDNALGNPHSIPLSGGVTASANSAFSLFPSSIPPSATVTAGQSATFNLSIFATGSLNGSVSLSCTGAPVGATCTPNPTNVTLGPFSTTNSFNVTVATTARTTAAVRPFSLRQLWDVVGVFLPLMMIATGRKLGRRTLLLIVLSAVFLGMALIACGGGGGSSLGLQGTPPGTYTLMVTGTSTNGISESTALVLTVQ